MTSKLSAFVWSDRLKIGHKLIDSQHKALFSLGLELEDIIEKRSKLSEDDFKQALVKVLKDLGQYTFFHFSYEEGVMRKAGYPKVGEHEKVHQELLAQLTAINNSIMELSNDELEKTLLQLVSSWLTDHITENDFAVGEFIRARERMDEK